MTAFALALAYVATLAFAGFLLWRRDRYKQDVRDTLVALGIRVAAMEHRKDRWDAAADYTEARQVERGLARGTGR